MAQLDLAHVRSRFAALEGGEYIYADNAGGSQCLTTVANRITDYLLHTNVQLGADYSVSVTSTNRVEEGIEAARDLFGADSKDEIAFGSSSTMLIENLARALDQDIFDGEEIIITGEHEANAGPWKKLAQRRGLKIKYWQARTASPDDPNPYAVSLHIPDLLPLISPKTRLITFTGCSNLLGSVVPIKDVIKAARATAAELGVRKLEFCVDCVAYAPHRQVDVKDWDVDYCFFSMYKVYGPHISVLYARAQAIKSSLAPLTHHFLSVSDVSYKLQPGGPGYELVYGCTAVPEYLKSLTPAGTLGAAFEAISIHEQSLVATLLTYLKSKFDRGVRIVGSEESGPCRVPTVSFVVVGEKPIASKDVVKVFDNKGGIGIRWGHFYAYTLVENLQPKIDVADAVVRISLVHYNTLEEVNRIINILEEVLA